ncbi:MAG: deoxyribodipyrimidine photo-lyase, partial [Alphaproteobacteria bacterium]
MKQTLSIVWFKRDLRVQDHAPLLAAAQTGNAVLPLYVVEPELWQQPNASRRHWHFIHDCLAQLNIDLANLGQPLCIQTGDMCDILTKLNEQHTIKDIFAHEETGNLWSFARDLNVHEFCRQKRILFHEFPANGVVRRLSNRDDWAKIRNSRMAEPIKPKPPHLKPL